uniref:Transmembrane protein 107 n=1 Tax=Ornithorhynchus anatinus TaxID=9258 RepID=A0A6I8N731_ORNAN
MGRVTGLVPSRFLTLVAHLVIVITMFWSREINVRASLPLEFTKEEYDSQDRQLVIALSVTLGLFVVELAGFFSGISMFNGTQSLLCIFPPGAPLPLLNAPVHAPTPAREANGRNIMHQVSVGIYLHQLSKRRPQL